MKQWLGVCGIDETERGQHDGWQECYDDGARPRLRKASPCVLHGAAVPIGHDGTNDGLDRAFNGRPVGGAFVELLARAAVDRYRADP